jgi:hypothetical protein
MKALGTLLLYLSTCSILVAQTPVNFDVMKLLPRIPPPPATVKAAFASVTVEEGTGSTRCSAAKLFESVEEDLNKIEQMFKSQKPSTEGALPPGVSPEMMKKAQDPEFKKKMKSMSREEKMKMAMEMMGSGTPGATVPLEEPPAVKSALDERMKLAAGETEEFQRRVKEQQEEGQAVADYSKGHADIGNWTSGEIDKLPSLSSGEMSYHDPAKMKAIRLKGADKHIALADRRLIQISKSWEAELKRVKARFSLFSEKLVAANFAAEAKNFSTKKLLADQQIIVAERVAALAKISRAAFEEAASWQAIRTKIELDQY